MSTISNSGDWVLENTDRTQDEISRLNEALSQKGPENDEQRAIFNITLKRIAPGRTDITTWFDLLDLDDAHAYNLG